jgi:two-component system sensor histidine kinase DctS
LSSLGEMSAGIAHEINNPLAIIMALAQRIKRRALKAPAEFLEIEKDSSQIIKTTERIGKIISSMRSLSRQNEGDLFELVKINEIILEIQEVSLQSLKAKDIEMIVNIDSDLAIFCNRGQMAQALLNLINNARDAVLKSNTRWISLEAKLASENKIEISIADSGNGIPKEIRSKIMQPFFTTKEIGKGTGLGLSLVRSIVISHNGQFNLDELSTNTRFVIQLPGKTLKVSTLV